MRHKAARQRKCRKSRAPDETGSGVQEVRTETQSAVRPSSSLHGLVILSSPIESQLLGSGESLIKDEMITIVVTVFTLHYTTRFSAPF
jgi:hypothetical protein